MDPIETFITQMQQRLDDALAGLPAAEQLAGAAPEAGVAVRACKGVASTFKDLFAAVRAKGVEIKEMATKEREKIAGEVKLEVVKDGAFLKASGLVTQADLDTALKAARGEEAGKVKELVEAGIKAVTVVAERRKALVTDKTLTAVAAEALPDELLQGDDFKTKVGTITGRLTKLAEIKALAADPDTIKRVVTMPITAEGESAFTESFGIWQKAAKGGAGPAAPLNPPAGDGARAVVLF